MITPRQTRLFRVPDLRAFRQTIRSLALDPERSRTRSCAVIVPSSAAADQLRRTFEAQAFTSSTAPGAIVLPLIVTRGAWYDEMHARLPEPPRRLTELEREVLLKASAHDVLSRIEAPFRLRPGLLMQMLGLYDDLSRRDVSVDTFERLIAGDLERDAGSDRGAERLLAETRFLAAAFRSYEARRESIGAVDESALRLNLLETPTVRPLRHVIVTVGERAVDPSGLWPADFDVLARLPGLERIDVVATRATIAAGLLDRLEKCLPGFEEGELPEGAAQRAPLPSLIAGTRERRFTVHRDRENELCWIARRLKASGGDHLERRAIVFKRPLPYVYLAREVFGDAGIPYQAFDALPLAAEPFAAMLDVIFECVTSNFTRESVVALLGSPHLTFGAGGVPLRRSEVFALSRALSEAGYVGGAERLRAFTGRVRTVARVAADAADELRPLTEQAPPTVQLGALLAFLEAHDRPPSDGDPLCDRYRRARSAVLSAIRGLGRAHQHLDDTPVDFVEVAAVLRRWIEGRTFFPRMGASGVQLIDAQAARYGEFDEVFLVGLVEGEWPERVSRSVFYPGSLLTQLDWPDSRMGLAGERALFRDLMTLPARRLHASTFELENDAIVSPSAFLEEIDNAGLPVEVPDDDVVERVFVHEALTAEPPIASALDPEAARWLAIRRARSGAGLPVFHGTAAPYRPDAYSISSLERYLQCPFKFFAERVLQLQDDPEDEATLNPRELGIFVHEVFRKFFEEWNRSGRQSITPENLPQARDIFRDVAASALSTLPDDQAAVQRTKLFGSAVDPGLAEAVFQAEAEWDTPIVNRLLEYSLEGQFEIEAHGQRRIVPLRGKADRIDLLADDSFRIIDYKLGRAPERKLSLQLPIYSVCAAQRLRQVTGKDWEPGPAGYIAFAQDREFIPMLGRGMTKEQVLFDAQERLLTAIEKIESGEFPPTPADTMMCTRCSHAAVCRKDYVGDV